MANGLASIHGSLSSQDMKKIMEVKLSKALKTNTRKKSRIPLIEESKKSLDSKEILATTLRGMFVVP